MSGGEALLQALDAIDSGDPIQPEWAFLVSLLDADLDRLRAALAAAEAAPLDVERLRVAMKRVYEGGANRLTADAIAREYAVLPDTETAERKHDPEFWADCAEGRCPHITTETAGEAS